MGALVNYSSDSSTDSEPSTKKLEPTLPSPFQTQNQCPPPPPPPPTSFHDLYASTVRTFDSPSLHQGRRRNIPHTPGLWPTHLYIEWHPSPAIHQCLTSLVTMLQDALPHGAELVKNLVATDLGTPAPLHISLSRPLSIFTAEKEAFRGKVEAAFRKERSFRRFKLRITGMDWHRKEESDRSFLVLRVGSVDGAGYDDGDPNPNPDLTNILALCNEIAREYGQPELYKWARSNSSSHTGKDVDEPNVPAACNSAVGNAFHISVAWSFSRLEDDVLQRETDALFRGSALGEEIMRTVYIAVEAVKVKIGNVVTSIPLGASSEVGYRAAGIAHWGV